MAANNPRTPSSIVRVIAVTGPAGAGKTALVHALAEAAAGKPVTPAQPPGQSVETGLSAFDFMGERYVFIDAPGAADFAADADFALPAADMAIVVADPDPDRADLAQPYLHELERQGLPHALFINKVDQAEGRVLDVLDAFQTISRSPLVARQIPIWRDDKVQGFVDLALERAYVYRPGQPSERIDIPADLVEQETQARFHLLEQLADYDDALMEQLLSDAMPSQDMVFADLVREMRDGLITPVFFGSAAQGFGLRRLLKALRHDTPSPEIAAARLGLEAPGVYVLKISHAGQAGKLAYARVFGAPLAETSELTLSDGARARAGALFSIASKKVSEAALGEIVAVGKIDPVAAGDVLAAGGPVLARAARPERFPVYERAIATTDRKDDVRLSGALAKLGEEDPGLSVLHNAETHEILLRGQGEPHLRLVLEKLRKRFAVDVKSLLPATPYKETIRKGVSQRGRHKKQTGGHGQFADVAIEIRPLARGEGFRFEDRISGGVVPRQWIPAVEQGVRDAMEAGPLGFPVVDVAVTLFDGAYHSVDSSELAFRTAGRIAMSEGLAACDPAPLEPIDALTVLTPSWGTPKINSAVSARGGQILGFEPRPDWPGWDRIEIYLPHAERHDFIIELRSLTQGLATFTARFSHMVEMTGRRAAEARRSAQPAA